MPSAEHARRLLIALLLVAVALTVAVVSPFWVAFFFAAVLAAALKPPMNWLSAKLGGRRNVAASILTVGVLLAVVLPIAALGAILVREAIEGVQWFRQALDSEGIWGLVRRLPGPFEDYARKLIGAVPQPQQQIQKVVGEQGGQAAGAVAGVLAATGSAAFQTVMMLIAFFFFLVDGARLAGWLDRHVPLRPGQFRQLLEDFRATSVSVLFATLATAGIQTAAALAGYLIFRVPNVVFLTLATFIVALIPAVGGASMVVVAGLIQIASGHAISGTLLVIWGLVVVSLVDNVARPYLLKGGMELHGGVVFFSLIGGLSVFGAIGLVIGPLALTFLLAVVKMYEREYADGTAATVPPGAAAPPAPAPPAPAASGPAVSPPLPARGAPAVPPSGT
jgi:predicted PurR-regulated permease PerM